MTSHVRHRRSTNPADPFVPMEPGEVAVNTANRQLAIGSGAGAPLPMIAVRFFDPASQYALNDFVAEGGKLYSAIVPVAPGPFNPTQWRLATNDPQDPTDLANYLQKTGGTMTGALILSANPQTNLEAATKQYVDAATPATPNAGQIASAATGDIAATNVQAAIAELESEKLAKAGGTMTGLLTLAAAPTVDLHAATKAYADTKLPKSGGDMTGAIHLGSTVGQYGGWVTARLANINQVSFEFGHPNTAGYGSTIGCEVASGAPFLAFHAGPGSNNDTYKTLGVKGSVLRSDLAGGFAWGSVAAASADNQPLSPLMSLSGAGQLVLPVGGLDMVGTFRVMSADAWFMRAGQQTTGLIQFGNTGTKYLYWDGANYNFVGGGVTLGANPTAAAHATTKQYVDSSIAAVTGFTSAIYGLQDYGGRQIGLHTSTYENIGEKHFAGVDGGWYNPATGTAALSPGQHVPGSALHRWTGDEGRTLGQSGNLMPGTWRWLGDTTNGYAQWGFFQRVG